MDSTEEKIRRVDVQLARLKKTLAAPGGALAKESVRQQAMNLIKQKRLCVAGVSFYSSVHVC